VAKAEKITATRIAGAAKRKSTALPASSSVVLGKLTSLGNATAASFAARFFKAGKGEYGEGDRFLGIRVPVLRALALDFRDAGLEVALPLLKSSWHEARAVALLLLVQIYRRGDQATQKRVYALYLKSSRYINNWDLVDMSAEHIVGAWLDGKPAERKRVLNRLARSPSLWERRIAMLATFYYIKRGDYAETLRLAEIMLKDEEDLVQKAVGWMLREVGKRIGEDKEESFLKRHYREMPRTMLRYAIERFAAPKRKRYLAGQV
jgi:3-methyladenine DNA glycosylase AlkD